jgi:hypothetical protein
MLASASRACVTQVRPLPRRDTAGWKQAARVRRLANAPNQGTHMNSNQQGQGSDKSPSTKDAGQQTQSGKQDQQGGAEAEQRKDFDKVMSPSDQQLRDATMKDGGDGKNSGGGKQSR